MLTIVYTLIFIGIFASDHVTALNANLRAMFERQSSLSPIFAAARCNQSRRTTYDQPPDAVEADPNGRIASASAAGWPR